MYPADTRCPLGQMCMFTCAGGWLASSGRGMQRDTARQQSGNRASLAATAVGAGKQQQTPPKFRLTTKHTKKGKAQKAAGLVKEAPGRRSQSWCGP